MTASVLLGILFIAGALIVPIAAVLAAYFILSRASRTEPDDAPVPPPAGNPSSGWGGFDPAPSDPAAPPPPRSDPAKPPASWAASAASPSAPPMDSSSQKAFVGNILRNLAGVEGDTISLLTELNVQIQKENQGRKLTSTERRQALIRGPRRTFHARTRQRDGPEASGFHAPG